MELEKRVIEWLKAAPPEVLEILKEDDTFEMLVDARWKELDSFGNTRRERVIWHAMNYLAQF